MTPFTHLHVHSQYSILDGAASIKGLVAKAKGDGMTALALTDHGMMFGIKDFYDTCRKEGIKPILGCETYVASRTIKDKSDKVDRSGEHLILLAKNLKGYRNLVKLISIASTEGFYYKPRIDKKVLEKYSEGLIVSSACLGGEVAQNIMKGNIGEAEETIKWFLSVLVKIITSNFSATTQTILSEMKMFIKIRCWSTRLFWSWQKNTRSR